MTIPKGWQTRVYKYWCEPATPNDRDVILQQVLLADNYMRDLVDAENALRDAAERIQHAHPDVATLVQAAHELPEDADREQVTAAWKLVHDACKVVRSTGEYKLSLFDLRMAHKAR